MFYGEHEHTIDRKSRVIIPSKFRQQLRAHSIESLFLTRGLDGCLFLFPEAEWRAIETEFQRISFTKSDGRQFNRMLFSGAVEVKPDGLGRVLIPKSLKEFAQIKEGVMMVGVSSRIELWAKEKWQEFYNTSRQHFEDVAEKVLPQ